jgi:hypothetical protein
MKGGPVSEYPLMPLMEDQLKVGSCYRLRVGGRPVVAKVDEFFLIELSITEQLGVDPPETRAPTMTHTIVRWSWRSAPDEAWQMAPGWTLANFALAAEVEVSCASPRLRA